MKLEIRKFIFSRILIINNNSKIVIKNKLFNNKKIINNFYFIRDLSYN